MSDLSPLSGVKLKSDFGAVRALVFQFLCLLRPAGSLFKRYSDPLFFAPNDMTMLLGILRIDQEVK